MRNPAPSGLAFIAFCCAVCGTTPAFAQAEEIPLVLAQGAPPDVVFVSIATIVLVAAAIVAIQLWLHRPVNITVAEARQYARWTLALFVIDRDDEIRLAGSVPDDYLADWKAENFVRPGGPGAFEDDAAPLEIHDVEGRLLFRDFTFEIDGNRDLRARTAASNTLGAPVLAIGVNRPLPIAERLAAARLLAQRYRLVPDPRNFLVCYADPHLGLLCRDRSGLRVVIDLAEQRINRIDKPLRLFARIGGRTPWSPFDPPTRRRVFKLYRAHVRRRRFNSLAKALRKRPLRLAAAAPQILPVNLVVQAKWNWCTAAAAEMILRFHGHNVTQDDFANAIPILPKDEGASSVEEEAAYKDVTNSQVVPAVDDTPTFAEVRNEIDGKRPLRYALPGHVRVVRGYTIVLAGKSGEWVYILDSADTGYDFHWAWSGLVVDDHIYIQP